MSLTPELATPALCLRAEAEDLRSKAAEQVIRADSARANAKRLQEEADAMVLIAAQYECAADKLDAMEDKAMFAEPPLRVFVIDPQN